MAKNCFRNGHKCNNELCNSLIVYHTRLFVHGDSKVTVRMSIVPSAVPASSQQTSATAASNLYQISSSSSNSSVNSQTSVTNAEAISNLSVAGLSSINNNSGSKLNSLSVNNPTQQKNQNQSQSTTAQSTQAAASTAAAAAAAQQQPIYDDINIFMWSVCKICNKSTKKTAMSPDTWSYSLAKFLELTFHGRAYHQFNNCDPVECKHSLFNDHYQYFRFKNIVTVFSLSKISMKSICIPIHDLRTSASASARLREDFLDEIKDLYEKGLSLFTSLTDRLSSLKGINLHEKQIKMLDQYIAQISSDTTLKNKIEKINLLLTNHETKEGVHASVAAITTESTSELQKKQQKNINYDLIDMFLIDLRKYIAASVQNWNAKMNDFFKKTKFDDVSLLQ